HRFGQFPTAGRPRQGVFGRAAGCLSDSEFLPVWKKYPGVAGTMIKADNNRFISGSAQSALMVDNAASNAYKCHNLKIH
ncbi:MAG: hypothetical protein V2B19_12340, partial [Pseudomonadota bacterium]